jgi:hypothetical protein
VRPLPGLALFAAAAVLAAGCTSAEGGEDSSKSTTERSTTTRTQDVVWLALLRQWEDDIARDATRAERIADAIERGTRDEDDLEHALRPLERCDDKLEDKVGTPEVPRYRRAYGVYRNACGAISDWADALGEEANGSEPASAKETRAKENKVLDLFETAELQLESSFRAVKPLPTAGGTLSGSRIEPRFGHALNKLFYERASAAQIEVRCWSKDDWLKVKLEWGGYAGRIDLAGFAYDGFRVSIAPEYCAWLVRLVYRHERPTHGVELLRAAAAVGLLAHEGGHLFWSETNEERTECFAMQRIRKLAVILGTSRGYGDVLAEVYWKYVYPAEPSDYRTPSCRDGGPLDINLKSSVWP